MVITGAGDGVMGAGHLGAGRKDSFGLNILLPFEQTPNKTIAGDHKLINFRYFFTRKLFFVKESKAVVFMPGGLGTQDEGFETLTLVQTGRSEPTPIVMLDAPGGTYWKDWNQLVQNQFLGGGYVSPEDEALYFITDDVEEACQEILQFYRVYHSSRYVDRARTLVLRLKKSLSEASIKTLNEEFQDIVLEGSIEACGPFPEEEDEPKLMELPRLSFSFNRRNFGRLRQLIDCINGE
jgi:predicted Rossmann-fold nucleotide-binding protein